MKQNDEISRGLLSFQHKNETQKGREKKLKKKENICVSVPKEMSDVVYF